MAFPVVMYGCESWTIKKAEPQRSDDFELWCWRRVLRVPWTARRYNKSILKEISLEYWEDWCWSWNSSTLATWCKGLTHLKRPWCWERFRAGGEGDNRGWDGWMASPTQWTWVWVNSGSWWWTGRPGVLQSMGSQRFQYDWATELNWTELKHEIGNFYQGAARVALLALLVVGWIWDGEAWLLQWVMSEDTHGPPRRLRWWRTHLQCPKPRFDPWVWKIPWRREWLPTPVFLPWEFHGHRSLTRPSPWDH